MKNYDWIRPFLKDSCTDLVWNRMLDITQYLLDNYINHDWVYYNEQVEFIQLLKEVANRNDRIINITPTDYIQIGEILL